MALWCYNFNKIYYLLPENKIFIILIVILIIITRK